MVLVSSLIDPVLCKKRTLAEKSTHVRATLRAFSESSEYWITATEGESSCGLIYLSIQPPLITENVDKSKCF